MPPRSTAASRRSHGSLRIRECRLEDTSRTARYSGGNAPTGASVFGLVQSVAWATVFLIACGKEQPEKQKRITPTAEELDTLHDDKPLPKVAPRQQTLVFDCFAEPRITPVPHSISSVTVGDFDRDGHNDVVVSYETLHANVFTGHVVTYRNSGDAKLVKHATIEAGDMAYAVSSGDIDGDGALDLAVGDPRGRQTRLYAGKGDGSFVEKAAIASRKPYGATLVDLDGDRRLDLVTELFSGVQVYRGDGKFGFKRIASIDTGQAPDGPVPADLDGDGVIDLGYAANDDGYFFTLKGPKYKQAVKHASACGNPAYTSGGDFDDDGDIDIGYVCPEVIELWLGDGKGAFRSVTYPIAAEEPIIAADLTGDGQTDLLVSHRTRTAGSFRARLVLLEGDGRGAHRERTSGKVPIVNGTKVADMDGDGRLDIVLGTWTGREAAVYIFLAQDCQAGP